MAVSTVSFGMNTRSEEKICLCSSTCSWYIIREPMLPRKHQDACFIKLPKLHHPGMFRPTHDAPCTRPPIRTWFVYFHGKKNQAGPFGFSFPAITCDSRLSKRLDISSTDPAC